MANNNRDVKLTLGVEADASDVTRLTDELGKATAATKELGKAADGANVEATTAKRARAEQIEALSRLRLEYRAGKVDAESFKTQELALSTALLDARTSVRLKTEALQVANAAVQKSAAYEKQLADQLRAVTLEQKRTGEAARTVSGDLEGIGKQLRNIQAAAGAVVGGQLLGGMLGDLAKTADGFANLSARIKLVTGDGDAFKTALQGVFNVAQSTGTSLETVGDLFGKIATAGKQIGVSNAQALALTETIAQATQLSGASADSANAAITQLVQGLQSGVLRGDEFNSVMEQAPRLARALADGLGVTTGELRKLAEAGTLTSQTVISALQGQGATLRAEFEQLPQTIGRAITNLSSAWTQYVGEADKASGASATIAAAINSLAKNLDTVANVLYGAGKAVAAFQAIRLAQTFTGIGVAAKVAAAETAAFTAAQVAANSATTGTAAGVGRLASLMGTLKLGALVAVAVNIKEIGTAIGEQFAVWAGYGDVIRDAEGRINAQEFAARSLAETYAALAQKSQIAADKALGLGVEAQALIGTFEKARQAGDTVADSLGKVAKALDLSNVEGIEAAGAALDALVVRGKITADQMQDVMSGALKGVDLGTFEAEAGAAFDNSEIGARRLAAAIDAMSDESLRRAGLSLTQLQTGFGAAFASAINDTDTLIRTLDRLGAKGPETGAALAKSLDKATEAAGTEKAVRAVIERIEALGVAGRLSGDQVAAGLEKARGKIDDLLPGVGTLREALHEFGLKSTEELKATADRTAAAWEQIKNSTTVSLDDMIVAFEKYAAAGTAANKGIEASDISLQRSMLRTRQILEQDLKPNSSPLQPQRRNDGPQRRDNNRQDNNGRNADGSYRSNEDSLGVIGPNQDVQSTLNNQGYDVTKGTNMIPMDMAMDVVRRGAKAFGPEDIPMLREAVKQALDAKQFIDATERGSAGSVSTKALSDTQGMVTATKAALEEALRKAEMQKRADVASTSHSLTIQLPDGTAGTFGMASAEDAAGVSALLARLEQAKRASAGGR